LKSTLYAEGAELVAGAQRWAEKLEEMGWVKSPNNKVDMGEEWKHLSKALRKGNFASLHAVLGSNVSSMSSTTGEVLGSIHGHLVKGGTTSIEGPLPSNLWNQEAFMKFVEVNELHYSITDKCRWGVGSQLRTRICSNIPKKYLKEIEKMRCSCGRKPHVRITSRYDYTVENEWVFNRPTAVQARPHLAAAMAEAHHRFWMDRVLEEGLNTMTINKVDTTRKAESTFNIIDSGAEKMFVRVGQAGNWEEVEVNGSIRCEGFDNTGSTYNLSRAQAVATTTAGTLVLLDAKQAITHEKASASSLIDPTALAAAGWKVDMDFSTSSGELQYGEHVISLTQKGAGIGFHTRKPTPKESTSLIKLPVSRIDYSKRRFLAEGDQQELTILRMASRTGVRFTKSKYNNNHLTEIQWGTARCAAH